MDSTVDIPIPPEEALETGPTTANEQATTAPAVSAGIPRTLIRPAGGWQLINVAELWHHRELLFFLTWRDVKVRYKQTALGAAWAVLQPAMMMIVFTIFFGRMAKVATGNLPYPIFAFAGLLPWTFFATSIANAGVSMVASERLITKIYFPRLAIPLAAVGAAIVDFVIALGILVLMIVFYRIKGIPIHVGPGILMAPVVFALIVLCAIGVSTMLAALTVAYRDFRYVIPFLVQLWLFATPSVYMQVSQGETTGKMQAALMINPMASLVAGFRNAMLGEPLPWKHLVLSGLAAVLLLLVGCLYFRKVEDSFADMI
jgi:lipopolysaccharide transport system permease protein